MTLESTQDLLWRAITWPSGVKDFLAQSDEATRRAFSACFRGTADMSAELRVEVYAESYFWRLHGVLEEQFPLEAWLLGEARFRNLVTDYVLAKPSIDEDLRQYGARFCDFLAEHESSRIEPDLASLARIDWALTEVLDESDDPILAVDALADIPVEEWPGLRFEATSSTRVLTSGADFVDLWRRRKRAEAPPENIRRHDPPLHIVVWREHYDVYHRRAEPGEGLALDAMMTGRPFAEICEAARGLASPEDVAGWLAGWLRAGLIRAHD